jgi:glycosyltransferase involved in cell wall biosynthesis
MKKLLFFTYAYPFSIDFSWKRNELAELSKHFEITVIPFIYQRKSALTNVPAGIVVIPPLMDQVYGTPADQFRVLLKSPRIFTYLWEFVSQRVFLRKKWVLEWLGAIGETEKLLKHPVVKDLMIKDQSHQSTILYFYWGLGNTRIIPFVCKSGFEKIVVRFHGFDLYEERTGGYLPFRRQLLKALDFAVPISENGLNYLKTKYPRIGFKSRVFRLGCNRKGDSTQSTDGKFRLASCSSVNSVKRIDRIIESLKFLDTEVIWTHLGDGEKFEEIGRMVASLPANITVYLAGRISPEQVFNFYVQNPVDLFLNVSLSEGVPVSIMEAFSAGIPVYATNVGGTSEIVDNSNGKLLDVNISPEQLAEEIRSFQRFPDEIKLQFRRNALQTYFKKCSFDKLNEEFISFLNS